MKKGLVIAFILFSLIVGSLTFMVQAGNQYVIDENQSVNAQETRRVIIRFKSPISDNPEMISDRINEKISENLLKDGLVQSTQRAESQKPRILESINGIALELTDAQILALETDPTIDGIQEDLEVHAHLLNSKVKVNAKRIAQIIQNNTNISSSGQSVCVIDTGVDYNHPNLNVIAQKCFIDYPGYAGCQGAKISDNASDDNGHGTHVAGIIASNHTMYNGIAYTENPSVNIVAVKALLYNGSGMGADIIEAIDWCVSNKALYNISVIQMSLGGSSGTTGTCDYNFVAIAANSAASQGIVVVASSGNSGHNDSIGTPACGSKVISVGAVDSSDVVTAYTNSNSQLDLLAPGSSITSTVPTGSCEHCQSSGFNSISGTSQAAPHVAAAAVLLIDAYKKYYRQNPSYSTVRNILKANGKNVTDTKNGLVFPRLDVLKSILSIDQSTPRPSHNLSLNNSVLAEPNISLIISTNKVVAKAVATINNTDYNMSGSFYNFTLNYTVLLSEINVSQSRTLNRFTNFKNATIRIQLTDHNNKQSDPLNIFVRFNKTPINITSTFPANSNNSDRPINDRPINISLGIRSYQKFNISLENSHQQTLYIGWWLNSTKISGNSSANNSLNRSFEYGIYNLTAMASDYYSQISSTWLLTVINEPPQFKSTYLTNNNTLIITTNATANYSITEPENLTFTAEFYDPENETIRIKWLLNGRPVLELITNQTNRTYLSSSQVGMDTYHTANYTFKGNFTSVGIYNITILINDSHSAATYNWSLRVNDSNDPPFWSSNITNLTLQENSTSIIITLGDNDFDNITLFLSCSNQSTLTINSTNKVICNRTREQSIGNSTFNVTTYAITAQKLNQSGSFANFILNITSSGNYSASQTINLTSSDGIVNRSKIYNLSFTVLDKHPVFHQILKYHILRNQSLTLNQSVIINFIDEIFNVSYQNSSSSSIILINATIVLNLSNNDSDDNTNNSGINQSSGIYRRILNITYYGSSGNSSNNSSNTTNNTSSLVNLTYSFPVYRINTKEINETMTLYLNVSAYDPDGQPITLRGELLTRQTQNNTTRYLQCPNRLSYIDPYFVWQTNTSDQGSYTINITANDSTKTTYYLYNVTIIDMQDSDADNIPDIYDDNDGVMDSLDSITGNASSINTTGNISITVVDLNNSYGFNETINTTAQVLVNLSNRTIINFSRNFTTQSLNLANISIQYNLINASATASLNRTTGIDQANLGYIIVNGLNGIQKQVTIENLNNSVISVCIKEAVIHDISKINHSCSATDEQFIECNNITVDGHTCYDYGDHFIITGLTDSAVKQQSQCIADWNCSAWSSGSCGTRTCTDLNDCLTDDGKPSEVQSCGSSPLILKGGSPMLMKGSSPLLFKGAIPENPYIQVKSIYRIPANEPYTVDITHNNLPVDKIIVTSQTEQQNLDFTVRLLNETLVCANESLDIIQSVDINHTGHFLSAVISFVVPNIESPAVVQGCMEIPHVRSIINQTHIMINASLTDFSPSIYGIAVLNYHQQDGTDSIHEVSRYNYPALTGTSGLDYVLSYIFIMRFNTYLF
ncbi:S8 family serine peptidase [Candidatus Woesearchaeota archaeon]|nr:S8 family serine peptidase [Candidatus Woesearchaeota archaeon]